MAAGEFFDLILPAALVLSAFLSMWVFASARKAGFRTYIALAWALATLAFPPVIFPLYLIARHFQRRRPLNRAGIRHRFALPALYLIAVLSFLSVYRQRESNSVDVHLAQASRAKVTGDRNLAIREYRRALALGDDPHTRKLLAIELADAGYLTEAIAEFRLAEREGEPDMSIPFRIGVLLDSFSLFNQAGIEYQRFLETNACTQAFPDDRCRGASLRLSQIKANMQ